MARCKNMGGGLGDDERHPPPSSGRDKGKGQMAKLAKKKRKRPDRATQIAIAIAEAADRAERGGSIQIEDLDPALVERAL